MPLAAMDCNPGLYSGFRSTCMAFTQLVYTMHCIAMWSSVMPNEIDEPPESPYETVGTLGNCINANFSSQSTSLMPPQVRKCLETSYKRRF